MLSNTIKQMKKKKEIQIPQNSGDRHRSTTFVKVDVQSERFPEMNKIIRSFLKVENLSIKLFYDFEKGRFVFKVYDKKTRSVGVIIIVHFEIIHLLMMNLMIIGWRS